jgi:PilZ domain
MGHQLDKGNLGKRKDIMEKERRITPRIEFHHDVIINRFRKLQKIRNFSTGGAFIQTDNPSEFVEGKKISLFTKFPLETKPTVMHAQIAHVGKQGIGVKFVELMGRNADVVEYNFEVFKGTLPLPGT